MTGNRKPARRAPRPGGATANTSLYERYKDALRRGHVAALRGRNEAAADAYCEATSIAASFRPRSAATWPRRRASLYRS